MIKNCNFWQIHWNRGWGAGGSLGKRASTDVRQLLLSKPWLSFDRRSGLFENHPPFYHHQPNPNIMSPVDVESMIEEEKDTRKKKENVQDCRVKR